MEQNDYLQNNKVLKTIINNGYEAYFVGGIVRDFLLKKEVTDKRELDIDITTSATPEQIKELFVKTYDTGIKHGTITVIEDDITYEITTFRLESKYVNHRKPKKVKYIKNVKRDVKRRDFTMNGLLLDEKLNVIDYINGKVDLSNKTIKCVGNANKRFKEDALRMLRAIRFSTQIGFFIEEKTYKAIKKHKSLLAYISKERIYQEFKKCVMGNYSENIKDLEIFDLFKNLHVSNIPIENDYILRLSSILASTENIGLLQVLKADKQTIKHVTIVLENLQYNKMQTIYEIRKLISNTTINDARRILILNHIDLTIFNQIINNKECLFIKQLVITGSDLIEEGIASEGKEIGSILKALLDEVLKNQSLNTYEQLILLSKSFR